MPNGAHNMRNSKSAFDATAEYTTAEPIDYRTPVYSPPHGSGPEKLFDITCVVGTVYAGGTANPRSVAFDMIAAHTEGFRGAEAKFTFPNEDGSLNHIYVSVEPRPADAS